MRPAAAEDAPLGKLLGSRVGGRVGDAPRGPGRYRTVLGVVVALLLFPGCSDAGADQGRTTQEGPPPVRFETGAGPDALALVIAISDYGAPPAGMKNARGQDVLAYRPLNAKNDVPLIVGGLKHHGFRPSNIQVLADSAADRRGMVRALDALVEAAGPGDVVVIHYSGHGHQLTDDDGPQDELDGYDEVLVPYGAPAELVKGYTGEYHLRDDVVGEYVQALRERVGSDGNVTVFLDACYSGTGTRGEDELPTRGMPEPLGEPHPAAVAAAGTGTRGGGPVEPAGTGFEVPAGAGTRGTAGGRADGDGLAPFTVISAASHNEVAHETYADDGATVVGSLSYALAGALPRLREGDSYNTLFRYVVSALHGRVRQTPQIEGDRDAVVFRPEFVRSTAPAMTVTRVADDGRVVLDAGGLVGLNPGARVSLYPPGGDPADLEPWAVGTVDVATPSQAVVELDRQPPADVVLLEARVFAERLAYGEATLRVELDEGLPTVVADSIRRQLADNGMLELVASAPDVKVGTDVVESRLPPEERSAKGRAYAGTLAAATVNEDVPLTPTATGPARAARPAGAPLVARRIEDWARNQYLRRIQFDDPGIDVDFELAVVRWDEATQSCTRPDWSRATAHEGYQGGGRWRLPANTDYVLRVRNNGDEALHFAVIDLMPPGDTVTFVKPLYPREDESAGATELPPGGELQIPETCFYTEPTDGLETLKLFVSTEPVPIDRLVGMRTRSRTRGGSISMTATREIHLRTTSGPP